MPETPFRTPKSRRTFEAVLQTASRLFSAQGYHATTIRDIARESGLGLGALYYYVRSKEELVLRFYERINQETLDAFHAQGAMSASLPDTLARFLRLKLEHLQPYRGLLRVVMKEAIDPESALCPLNPASSSTLTVSVDLFHEMIVRAQSAKGQEAEDMARALWLAHMGVLAYWLHDKSEHNAATQRAIDTLAHLVRLSATLNRVPGIGTFRRQIYSLVSGLFSAENPVREIRAAMPEPNP